LIEFARSLAEEAGQLDKISATTRSSILFSGGVQQVLRRRLAKVPEPYQPLLQVAAAIGRWLDMALLEQLAAGIDLEDWLTTCVNAAVFTSQDERWQFAHDKLREYLLNLLPSDDGRHCTGGLPRPSKACMPRAWTNSRRRWLSTGEKRT